MPFSNRRARIAHGHAKCIVGATPHVRSIKQMVRSVILALLLVLIIAAVGFVGFSWRAEIEPVEPVARASFSDALIARGAHLAATGDCIACHTAPDGRPYAGGLALRTQFGTIYGTNITPDPETGIGRWSSAAFTRALREGVDRLGRHLYPAFPYDHFTLLGDEDINALYAFMMTREPVRQVTPENEVVFPLNFRVLVAGWKLLFLDRVAFRSDPAQSEEWNRGAYLVQGLAHCGACHTPRNFLGAEKKKLYLAGGEAESWHAPAINAASRAPIPWTADSLFRYLRHGIEEQHEVAAGPMAPVAHNLSAVPESEVRAISTYITSIMGQPDAERRKRAETTLATARAANDAIGDYVPEPEKQARASGDATLANGASLYAGSCAVCHGALQRGPGSASSDALHLSLSSSVSLASPGNLIRIILQGMAPPDGERGPFMPGFAGAYTDEQVASLASYLRASYTDRPAWPNVEREVRRVRQSFAQARE
jgi:mono/diheme cytochrome c family protein